DGVNSPYRVTDLMLTRLVDLAGPDAGVLVISDHGFHSDHLRPRFVPNIPAGIVAWHRPFGIIAGSGHGFPTHGQSIFGAGLQDVAPTILQWFGIPRAKDMMGRVLADALLNPNKLEEVETYENRDAAEPKASCFELKDHDRRAMLEHFVDLGYIEELPSDAQAACEQTTNENRWQLACSLLHSGRYEEALPLLEQAHDANPMRPDIAQRLAHCQLHFGLADQATVTIESSIAGFQDANAVSMIRAQIANQKGDYSQAIQLLDEVRLQMPNYPGLREQLARTYLHLRRWDLAETLANEIIESDPSNAQAWAILSRCQLHRNDHTGCIDSALEAIHLNFSSPMAHVNLGIALARTHKYSKAVTAFRNAIKLAPANIPPYRFLSHVYSRMGMHEESIQWMNQARQMRQELDAETRKTIQRVKQSAQERAVERSNRPKKPAFRELEPLDLLLVSGLPRSGTSLMMQILQAGGVPLLTDGKRTADEDNPEGYWEWEAIKGIARNPEILSHAQGKAVKVISALIDSLPRMHTYRILYMVRPIEEIIASQYKMLERKGITSKYDLKEIATLQQQHSLRVRESLKRFDQVKLLEVSYPELISCPDRTLSSIAAFLGGVFRMGPNVYECIKPSLYRQRN
ncbi:MAG: tetratricopeptide repeat protein, partial [Planctomycetota bacterium]